MNEPTSQLPLDPTAISPFQPRADLPRESQAQALESLLLEINSLGICLRQRGRPGTDLHTELPTAAYAVLEILDRAGAATVPQIARARATSRQNIQILVDRLTAQGRVEIHPNPAHKRSCLIQLTAEGKSCLEAGGRDQRELLTNIAARFTQPEINATVAVLRRIHGLLSGKPGGGAIGSVPARPQPRAASQKPALIRKDLVVEELEFPVNLL